MAIHNLASRYLYSFGRDGILPGALAITHRKYRTPFVASTTQMLLMALAILACLVTGADPYSVLGGVSGAFASLGATFLMMVVSFSAVRYLKRSGEAIWTRLIAPILAGILLAVILMLIILNFHVLSGATGVLAFAIPALIPAIGIAGTVHGYLLERRERGLAQEIVAEAINELANSEPSNRAPGRVLTVD